MKATSKEEALYLFVNGEEYDEETYDSFEEAVDNEVSSAYGTNYEIDGEEYLVCEDEDEARDEAIENLKNLFDDIGVFGLSDYTTNWILDNALDDSWFAEAMSESDVSYAEDIKDEESSDEDLYVSRLHEEMVEMGIMEELDLPEEPEDEDELEAWEEEVEDIKDNVRDEVENKIDEFVDKRAEDYGNPVEWFEDNFGREELSRVAKDNYLVDEDAVAEMIIDTDGLGHTLSSYDGEEHEQDGYLIFRTN